MARTYSDCCRHNMLYTIRCNAIIFMPTASYINKAVHYNSNIKAARKHCVVISALFIYQRLNHYLSLPREIVNGYSELRKFSIISTVACLFSLIYL